MSTRKRRRKSLKDNEERLPRRKTKNRVVAKQEAENDTFFTLPDEIMLIIFGFIPFHMREAIACVSRRCNRLVLDWTLWKNIPWKIHVDNLNHRVFDRLLALAREAGYRMLSLWAVSLEGEQRIKKLYGPVAKTRQRRSIVALMRKVTDKTCDGCKTFIVGKLRLSKTCEHLCSDCYDEHKHEAISLRHATKFLGVTKGIFRRCQHSYVVGTRTAGAHLTATVWDLAVYKAKNDLALNKDVWTCAKTKCDCSNTRVFSGIRICRNVMVTDEQRQWLRPMPYQEAWEFVRGERPVIPIGNGLFDTM